MGRTLRDLWNEPAVPHAPGPMPRDWVWVALVVVAAVVEGMTRDGLAWRGASLALFPLLALALPWRRVHPLGVAVAVFGSITAIKLAATVADVEWTGLFSGACLLVVPYTLFRWASGRHAAAGFAVVGASAGLDFFSQNSPAGDVFGGFAVLLFTAVLGSWVRTLRVGRERELEQVRLREREQLARELHDSVAHHVSAIAIQAQAGRTVGPTNPGAAIDALVTIEEEASRTLAEMRSILGVLRAGNHTAERAPQAGVAELRTLAREHANGIRVNVEFGGDLNGLEQPVEAALYRLAQESITNAVRHARNASLVSVTVDGDDDQVRLGVTDDGDPVNRSAAAGAGGYGLIGMAERASLLGGTIEAGPAPDRGWVVAAVLPRRTGTSGRPSGVTR